MKTRENINWELLAKYLSGEATIEESQQVKAWIEVNSTNQKEFENIEKTWNTLNTVININEFDVEKSLKQVKNKFSVQKQNYNLNRSYLLKIAASIVLIISIGTGIFYLKQNFKNNVISISSGNQSDIIKTLPDGTVISLNANTVLTYPKKFKSQARKVSLSGEAYFEVTPDKTKPFIIETSKSVIKVLGTSFNVNAYENSEKSVVSVNTGMVEVCKKKILNTNKSSVILEKGTQGVLNNANVSISKQLVNNKNFIAWKTKKIVFEKTPLPEVKTILESVYQVKIKLGQNELENLNLTATFDNEDIKTVIDVVQITFNIKASFSDTEITLYN